LPQSRRYVQNLIPTMAANDVEAVILGFTELPLLLSDAPYSIPLMGSTRLLAGAAFKALFSGLNLILR
jgi:aspartate racemase